MSATIDKVRAREVLDSRGNPTLEAEVGLSDGASGRAIVPSGASTGSHEATELRDGNPARFRGAGVLTAVANVVERIGPAVRGLSSFDQAGLDRRLLELDGTSDKSNLGANAILGVSLAAAHAAAASRRQPLYRHLAEGDASLLPVPLFNVLNGGKHAADSTDIQEFMLAPAGAPTYGEALRAGAEVYQSLKRVLSAGGYSTNVGDEGGYAPSLPSNRSALAALVEAISLAGYAPGKDVFLALDVAASELFEDGRYALPREGAVYTSAELVSFYASLVEAFPIVSIEDGLAEDDWEGWTVLVQRLGGTVQLVGDDLLTTSAPRIRRAIDMGAANALLVKPNQVGTLTETLEAMALARSAGWGTVMSHRSGETEDTTIADLAVATGAGQIKAGAPAPLRARGEVQSAAAHRGGAGAAGAVRRDERVRGQGRLRRATGKNNRRRHEWLLASASTASGASGGRC